MFKGPPPARSGVEYGTLAQRCAACEMAGGEESPCFTPIQIHEWQREFGQPCPYTPLQPGNGRALRLTRMLMSDALRPLAPWLIQSWTDAGYDLEEIDDTIGRAVGALGDPKVRKLLHPEPQGRPSG